MRALKKELFTTAKAIHYSNNKGSITKKYNKNEFPHIFAVQINPSLSIIHQYHMNVLDLQYIYIYIHHIKDKLEYSTWYVFE